MTPIFKRSWTRRSRRFWPNSRQASKPVVLEPAPREARSRKNRLDSSRGSDRIDRAARWCETVVIVRGESEYHVEPHRFRHDRNARWRRRTPVISGSATRTSLGHCGPRSDRKSDRRNDLLDELAGSGQSVPIRKPARFDARSVRGNSSGSRRFICAGYPWIREPGSMIR